MCLKYFVDAGAMAVRRVLKKDLKRIAKATGGQLTAFAFICSSWGCFILRLFILMTDVSPAATVCSSLSNLEGEETYEAAMLGQAEEVVQERVCDDELILVKKWDRVPFPIITDVNERILLHTCQNAHGWCSETFEFANYWLLNRYLKSFTEFEKQRFFSTWPHLMKSIEGLEVSGIKKHLDVSGFKRNEILCASVE